jgi:hypothetical protein
MFGGKENIVVSSTKHVVETRVPQVGNSYRFLTMIDSLTRARV